MGGKVQSFLEEKAARDEGGNRKKEQKMVEGQ